MKPIYSILIVDDEPSLRNLLTIILKSEGYQCATAENAAMAKQVLREKTFDLLLTDMNMPGESGSDLIRYVQAHYPRTAAIMVTIIDDPSQAREVLDLGIYGYIVKPFTKNLVIITVRNALRRHGLEQQERHRTHFLELLVEEKTKSLNDQVFFLQTLIDTLPVPIYYKNTTGSYLGCNRAYEMVVQQDRKAIIGKSAADIHSTDLARSLVEMDRELLKEGGVQVCEKDFASPDGAMRTGVIHKATFCDSNGEVAGVVGVRLDITELKQTERSLRLSEAKLRSIMDNLHIGVAMITPQLQLLEVNRQLQEWFPHVAGEVGKASQQLFGDQQALMACNSFPRKRPVQKESGRESILKLRTVDGERIFRTLISPVYDEEENLTAAVRIFEDITEQLNIERELRQAQKLEAIGQLAKGIAHEINTPMQYLGDNIHFLEDAFIDLVEIYTQYAHLLQTIKEGKAIDAMMVELEDAVEQADLSYLFEEIPKTIRQSLDGVDRVGTIVRAMREFSHPGSDEKSVIDINHALNNTLIVSRNEWKYVADVETDFAPDLPLLRCLPGEINQVFLNIIINAAHAIADVTQDGSKGKGHITLSTCVHGQWMEIRISDTGGGIPEAVQHRIFDPFFTTKKVGKGTGQGLAIARSVVVDKHQGTIRFETVKGKGTTFIIQLPLDETVR